MISQIDRASALVDVAAVEVATVVVAAAGDTVDARELADAAAVVDGAVPVGPVLAPPFAGPLEPHEETASATNAAPSQRLRRHVRTVGP